MSDLKISASMVKTLRTETGAGVLDCRNALVETEGDFEAAVALLRKKGAAEAEKRKERETNEGIVSAYIHTGGRIGAMVELNCETDFVARLDQFQDLAKELTMQVAATRPLFVQREDIPEELIAEKKTAFAEGTENKPDNIVERIVEGRLEKFFKEVCLLEQPYIRDDEVTVRDLIDQQNATLGENIIVRRFARFELGQ